MKDFLWSILLDMRTVLFTICLFFAVSSSAGFYKWVDENGEVHYSDRPVPNAQTVRISNSTAKAPTQSSTPSEEGVSDLADGESGYLKFEIVSPTNNETIRNNDGQVNISLLLEPALQAGHKIRLNVDTKELEGGFASTQLALRKLSRGSHSLQAVIVDEEGQFLVRSAAINFHLRRASDLPPVTP